MNKRQYKYLSNRLSVLNKVCLRLREKGFNELSEIIEDAVYEIDKYLTVEIKIN